MCENCSKLGQDPTPFSQPCLIRPSSSKGRSCAAKPFPFLQWRAGNLWSLGWSFLSPLALLLWHPDPDGPSGFLQDSSLDGIPHSVTEVPSWIPTAASLNTSMMYDLPFFLEQFSKVQSIRKKAHVKSSHIQERFFVQLAALLAFFFWEEFWEGGIS